MQIRALLVIVVAIASTSCSSSGGSLAPSATSATPQVGTLTATWGRAVSWPSGGSITVGAPRYRLGGDPDNRAFVEVEVQIFNGGQTPYKAGSHLVDVYTDDRRIIPIVPDVDGMAVRDKVINPGSSLSYLLVFATGMLGKTLTLKWSSIDTRVWPPTTIEGQVTP